MPRLVAVSHRGLPPKRAWPATPAHASSGAPDRARGGAGSGRARGEQHPHRQGGIWRQAL